MIQRVVLFSSLLLLFNACDFYDSRLIINNNSSRNIYVAIIPDTILSLGENNTFIMPSDYIKKFSKKNLIFPGKKGWEELANKSVKNKLHVFILNEDTLKSYSAEEIVKKQLFEKRIDIGVEDLMKNRWEVEYKAE